MRSSVAPIWLRLCIALMAMWCCTRAAFGAYRLISADPLVQTITDIPLQGFNLASPEYSNRTAKRAAPFFDGDATRSWFELPIQQFTPDAATDDTLIFPTEGLGSINSYDLIRVPRTGEIMRIIVAIEDVVTVVRGWAGTTPAAVQPSDHIDIISLNTSFVCWYYCEKESQGRSTIWEVSARQKGQATTAIFLERSQSGWSLASRISGVSGPSMPLTFDPRGKWMLISLAHRNTELASDQVYLTVRNPDDGALSTSILADFAVAFNPNLIPDSATIGDRYAIMWGNTRAAPGICIPAITMDCLADGRIGTVSLQAVANGQGLTGHISLHGYEACAWATNYSAGALSGGANDARAGVISGALHTFDSGNIIFPRRHQFDPGRTFRGALVSVDPYTFGVGAARIARPHFDDRIDSVIAYPGDAQTFHATGGVEPAGIRGPKSGRFASAVLNGLISERLRVGVFGNSRAVFPVRFQVRLSDGTFLNRAFATNFVDMGITAQAPLYHNGLIVGRIGPVPWCGWTGSDSFEAAYGIDCSVERPLSRNVQTGDLVLPSTAMTSLIDSTLGSRFGIFSPLATRVAATGYPGSAELGALDHYRGNHASIRLRPNHSTRFMIRPENGLPTTDPLRVTMYIQNHPSSASVSARAVRAMSQAGAEVWSESVSVPSLGSHGSNPTPALKSITVASDATMLTATVPGTRGFIEVHDADGGFANIQVGDMVQIADSSGAFQLYNEAFSVADISRNAGNLRLFYDITLKRPPTPGDRITFIPCTDILRKITVELPPCPEGQWRGIEIASDDDGDGVLLWGFGFENPARNGIVTISMGRSGCGALIQYQRLPLATSGDRPSLFRRILDELQLDVAVLATADQGTPGGRHVGAYENMIDIFHLESPATECVVYGTGPEYRLEDHADKSDMGNKFSVYVAMKHAAMRKGVPATSFYGDVENSTSAFGRLQSGIDTTEGATHPSTILDVTILARQLMRLPEGPPTISPGNQIACASGSAEFTVPQSPDPGVTYRWQIEDPSSPSGYSDLQDGELMRNGVLVAEFAGTHTRVLSITRLSTWSLIPWADASRARLRCSEIRTFGTLISDPATLSVCPADIDCSGGVDGDDVISFFASWDLGDPITDLTGDGGVDGDDVIEFFARWDAGC